MWFDSVLKQLPPLKDAKTAVAIGTFDGVHIGHQKLIATLFATARADGLTPLMLVFEASPSVFFEPTRAVQYLGTLEERVRQIKALGAARVAALKFNAELQKRSAAVFLADLRRHFNCAAFVFGENATIGADRAKLAKIGELAATLNIKAQAVAPAGADGEEAHSSVIRAAVRRGDVARAAKLLGRPFSLSGRIVAGDRLGGQMGFPTANLELAPNLALPADAVYAARVAIDAQEYKGATSIGVRPTVSDSGVRTVETHILDFDGDLYGRFLELRFVKKLRDEFKYDSIERLKTQMADDVAQTRKALADV